MRILCFGDSNTYGYDPRGYFGDRYDTEDRWVDLLAAPPPMKRGAWVPTDELAAESIQLAEEYKLLARKLNIPFVDTRYWNIELTFDGVHFTEAGHHTFAENLRKELRL